MLRFSFILVVLLVCLANGSAWGQTVMPRAGRNFTFGIIEGPDRISSSGGPFVASQLTLTVLGPYDGSGTVTSPSGYTQPFSFTANHPTIVDLPHNLTHQTDLGKTSKGILVHTSQPVNLALWDSVPEAGDASQIYPDEALDTSYVVSEWGLWNDVSEGNRVEFLVTASEDSTHLTIVPSSMTMLLEPSNTPIEITLMKGECYMVKADSNSRPKNTWLSGSTVRADKPVSVMVGTTCGYVPVGVQSCNELMDELVGKQWWGDHFFVQPLGNVDSKEELLFTSDTDFVATINGSPSVSMGKRLVAEVQGVAEILVTSPVEVHQLTRGSSFSFAGQGDPTLVSILPVSQYSDTMMWSNPHIVESDFSTFSNWTPIIYPTADFDKILLDGTRLSAIPLSKLSDTVRIINGSAWSALNPSVSEGVHTLFSPVPVFVLATGFQAADAYSFIPGTVLAPVKPDGTQGVRVPANESASLAVTIFPNPSTSYVKIVGSEQLSNIALVDPLGRIVRNATAGGLEHSFDVEGIPSGTYYVVASGTSTNASVRTRISIIH